MANIKNFKADDGRIDWPAYRVAQVADGSICERCHQMTIGRNQGAPRLCYECRGMDTDEGECMHAERLRCPTCQHQFAIEHGGEGDYHFGADDGETQCPRCDHEFTFQIAYETTFTSPALLAGEDAS